MTGEPIIDMLITILVCLLLFTASIAVIWICIEIIKELINSLKEIK